jgi:hypothetical protein
VEHEKVGVVLRHFDNDAYQKAADEALLCAQDPYIGRRCRRVARVYFDLQTVGGERYVNVYRRLTER